MPPVCFRRLDDRETHVRWVRSSKAETQKRLLEAGVTLSRRMLLDCNCQCQIMFVHVAAFMLCSPSSEGCSDVDVDIDIDIVRASSAVCVALTARASAPGSSRTVIILRAGINVH